AEINCLLALAAPGRLRALRSQWLCAQALHRPWHHVGAIRRRPFLGTGGTRGTRPTQALTLLSAPSCLPPSGEERVGLPARAKMLRLVPLKGIITSVLWWQGGCRERLRQYA